MLTLLQSQKDRSLIKKKKLLGIFIFCFSYCNCFLPLFCLIVLKFLCTNFSVLLIRFSECSVHFPCTEVTNPQPHTLLLPPDGGCYSSPCGLLPSPLTLPHSPTPFWVFLTSLPVSEAFFLLADSKKGRIGEGNTRSLASLENLHPPLLLSDREAGCTNLIPDYNWSSEPFFCIRGFFLPLLLLNIKPHFKI